MTTSEVDTTVGQENGGTGYKTTMPGVTTGILLLRPENDSVEYELEVLVIKKTLKRRP